MKQLFVCELCGAAYEDYGKCNECERTHCKEFFGGKMEEELHKKYQYQPNKALPTTVFAAVKREVWNKETEAFDTLYHIGMYELKKELPKKEVDELVAEQRKMDAEEKAYWDKYWAEKRAEQEAKEAAKAETEVAAEQELSE